MRDDDDAWFAPKLFGIGFRPVRWQGWLITGFYAVSVIGLSQGRLHPGWLAGTLIAVLTIGFIGIAAHNSRGAMTWRWGRGDER